VPSSSHALPARPPTRVILKWEDFQQIELIGRYCSFVRVSFAFAFAFAFVLSLSLLSTRASLPLLPLARTRPDAQLAAERGLFGWLAGGLAGGHAAVAVLGARYCSGRQAAVYRALWQGRPVAIKRIMTGHIKNMLHEIEIFRYRGPSLSLSLPPPPPHIRSSAHPPSSPIPTRHPPPLIHMARCRTPEAIAH
jgi:hypothetical protein